MGVTDRPERPSGGGRDALRPTGSATPGSVVSDPVARSGPEARSGAAARSGTARRSGAPGRRSRPERAVPRISEPWPRAGDTPSDRDAAPPARTRDGVEIYDPLGLYQGADRSHQPLRARWDPTAPDESRSRPRPERGTKKQSAIGRFVSTYGWRAYALPILFIVTVLVVVDAVRGGGAEGAGANTDPSFGRFSPRAASAGVIGAPPGDGQFPADLPTGALPEGGPFVEDGTGTWRVVPGTTAKVGEGREYSFRYTVEIEDGIDTSGFGGDESVAKMIDSTLANPKSWSHDPKFAFQRIDQGEPDFRISLTSRQTTREVCGFEIPIDSSCYHADLDRVVLSEVRWVRGALAFEGDIGSYRQYQINHEVGHAIGYHQHQPCETDGGLAPIMMQQTFGTKNNDIAELDPHGVVPMDGKRCRFNPWPYPRG
ncbi:uncharacterized protein DUF3152 [Nocardia puris]|uniref:Uncharacterized protein DUF3152 n=1 Tax=Nocardia puris TaxID=208602 RepID=A0A366DT41_9NOCA|nr:uncharacterized protein DUF3152 [Nocardia puris]